MMNEYHGLGRDPTSLGSGSHPSDQAASHLAGSAVSILRAALDDFAQQNVIRAAACGAGGRETYGHGYYNGLIQAWSDVRTWLERNARGVPTLDDADTKEAELIKAFEAQVRLSQIAQQAARKHQDYDSAVHHGARMRAFQTAIILTRAASGMPTAPAGETRQGFALKDGSPAPIGETP